MIKEVNKQGIRKLEKKRKKKVDRNERKVCTEFKYLLGFRIRMLSFKTKEFIPIKYRTVNKLNLPATRNINIEFLFC